MKFTKTSKVAMALGAGAIAIASTGVAYAFIGVGASGSTNGTAGVTTTNPLSNVTLSAADAITGLVPGTASNVLVTVSNPNNFSVGYPTFHVSVAYGSPANSSCTSAQADISGTSAAVPAGTLVHNGSFTVTVPVTMGDAGTGQDQSSCLVGSQSIPLTYSIS